MRTQELPAFGSLLRRLRRAAGLTQEDLAECSGLSVASISGLERGLAHVPRRDTLELLARALELSPADHTAFLTQGRATAPAAPPEHAGPATPAWYGSLPAPPTPLLGRAAEVATLTALLGYDGGIVPARLVTLTGPGGVGKTHLALQVASIAGPSFPHGARFVSLAPLRDPALFHAALTQALGITDAGPHPLRERLYAHLRDRHCLLLLDNFEHLATAASLVADLLAACPSLAILATSRVPLRLRAEQRFPVDPLPVPDLAHVPSPEKLATIPAVDLFVRRARAVDPGFALTPETTLAVAEICVRLDGLPLAIELAAARVLTLPPPALLARLGRRLPLLTGGARDLPERQQTLRATLAWSDELLTPDEQRVLRRLSVFAGGCTADAAAVVCGDRSPEQCAPAGDGASSGVGGIESGLETLVEHSLLRLAAQPDSEHRFVLLETVREYGQERLEESGEAGRVRRQHAAYFLRLADEAEPELRGEDQEWWLGRLEREHGNLRAALSWTLGTADHPREARESISERITTGMRMAGALARFWYQHGHLSEGRGWLEQALALDSLTGEIVPRAVRASALYGAGWLAFSQSDYECAEARCIEGLGLCREVGDERGSAAALTMLGNVAAEQGDSELARRSYEESLAVRRRLGDPWGIASALSNLGVVARRQGDYLRAVALIDESLAVRRRLGDTAGIAVALNGLGHVALVRSEYARATASFEEVLALARRLENRDMVATALHNLAQLAREQGNYARATSLAQKGRTLFEETADEDGIASVLQNLAAIALDQGEAGRAAALASESYGLFQMMRSRRGGAEALVIMALAELHQGDSARAMALAREGLVLSQAMGSPSHRISALTALGMIECARGAREAATVLFEESLALCQAIGARREAARCLEGLAGTAGLCGDLERATRLWGAAAALREAIGAPLPLAERASGERALAAARAALGDAAFAQARAMGRSLSPEQAAEALSGW